MPEIAPQPARKIGRALVIDDSFLVRRLLKANLERLGFDVQEAAGGVDALKIGRDGLQDMKLLVVDLSMPDIHGADLIALMKRLPGGDVVKILVCSSHTEEVEIRKVMSLGVDGYLVKPVNTQILSKKIESLFP